jgi:two-component system chemotaxis response regulator CheB
MLLVQLLNSDPKIHVSGTAKNGLEAIESLAREKPDLILMDVEMPEMDGLEAARRIMETRPVPIVICSGSSNQRGSINMFRLVEVGAVAFVDKPRGRGHKDFESSTAHLIQTVKLMSEVKVVRRWPRRTAGAGLADSSQSVTGVHRTSKAVELIGIGASTGGPLVLQTILNALPASFPAPLVIVQHIAPGFVDGLAEWLNQPEGIKVHVAASGMRALAGHAYLAPDDFHLTVRPGREIVLIRDPPLNNLRPSVDRLFQSLAETYGPSAVGVLLTGMGKDGAAELRQMKDRGAFTIVQDRESSIVHGMPGEAIELGAASIVLPPDKIGSALISQVSRQSVRKGGSP